jgi:hypothetical protein
MNTYTPLPPHTIPPEAKPYVDQMDERTRSLHDLAIQLLGSSYFVEYSHGYRKWKAAQKPQDR